MTPSKQSRHTGVFSIPLERIVNATHPLCALAGKIAWDEFDTAFGFLYGPGVGGPGKPVRLMAGLHYIKHAFSLGGERAAARWVENP